MLQKAQWAYQKPSLTLGFVHVVDFQCHDRVYPTTRENTLQPVHASQVPALVFEKVT